jgi:hypothetical protein
LIENVLTKEAEYVEGMDLTLCGVDLSQCGSGMDDIIHLWSLWMVRKKLEFYK